MSDVVSIIADTGKEIPCKYCGDLTPMLGTKQCDNCWEASSRVRDMDKDVLLKILRVERDEIWMYDIPRKVGG